MSSVGEPVKQAIIVRPKLHGEGQPGTAGPAAAALERMAALHRARRQRASAKRQARGFATNYTNSLTETA
jgi:hypothetical protein